MRAESMLVWRGGLFTGLVGYGTIVVFFAALNLFAGRSVFYTAALFGSAMFLGREDPSALVITPQAVLTFNMVHLLVMLAVGLLMSWLIAKSERYPLTQWAVLMALIFVGFHLFAAVVLFASPLMGSLGWVPILVASVAAAITMGWYMLRLHPFLRRELKEIQMGEVPPA